MTVSFNIGETGCASSPTAENLNTPYEQGIAALIQAWGRGKAIECFLNIAEEIMAEVDAMPDDSAATVAELARKFALIGEAKGFARRSRVLSLEFEEWSKRSSALLAQAEASILRKPTLVK